MRLVFPIILVMLLSIAAVSYAVEEASGKELAQQILEELQSGNPRAASDPENTRLLEKAAIDHPKDPMILYALASCYLVQDRPLLAARFMERAYIVSSRDPNLGIMYATMLKMAKQPHKAYELCREMHDQHPHLMPPKMMLAVTGPALQKYDESILFLETFRKEMKPSDAPKDRATILMLLGTTYLFTGQHDQAVSTLEEADKILPKAAVVLGELGHAYLKSGQTEKAVRSFEKVRAINPKVPSVLYYEGLLLERAKKSAEARKKFEAAYEHGLDRLPLSDNGRDYFIHAEVCSKLGREQEAAKLRSEAKALGFTFDAPWNQITR